MKAESREQFFYNNEILAVFQPEDNTLSDKKATHCLMKRLIKRATHRPIRRKYIDPYERAYCPIKSNKCPQYLLIHDFNRLMMEESREQFSHMLESPPPKAFFISSLLSLYFSLNTYTKNKTKHKTVLLDFGFPLSKIR